VPSVARSTILLGVVVEVDTAYGWHTPPVQTPPPHECPQLPQLELSVKLLHPPLQAE
jgi:hypothetical protein